MSEDGYMIARVIFLLCLLVLIAPAFISMRVNLKTTLRYAALWIGIVAGAVLIYPLWKG